MRNLWFCKKRSSMKLLRKMQIYKLIRLCVADCSGIGNYVAYVGNACKVHYDSFKAEAVARVLCSAVFAEIYVPPVILFVKMTLQPCGKAERRVFPLSGCRL